MNPRKKASELPYKVNVIGNFAEIVIDFRTKKYAMLHRANDLSWYFRFKNHTYYLDEAGVVPPYMQ